MYALLFTEASSSDGGRRARLEADAHERAARLSRERIQPSGQRLSTPLRRHADRSTAATRPQGAPVTPRRQLNGGGERLAASIPPPPPMLSTQPTYIPQPAPYAPPPTAPYVAPQPAPQPAPAPAPAPYVAPTSTSGMVPRPAPAPVAPRPSFTPPPVSPPPAPRPAPLPAPTVRSAPSPAVAALRQPATAAVQTRPPAAPPVPLTSGLNAGNRPMVAPPPPRPRLPRGYDDTLPPGLANMDELPPGLAGQDALPPGLGGPARGGLSPVANSRPRGFFPSALGARMAAGAQLGGFRGGEGEEDITGRAATLRRRVGPRFGG